METPFNEKLQKSLEISYTIYFNSVPIYFALECYYITRYGHITNGYVNLHLTVNSKTNLYANIAITKTIRVLRLKRNQV